MSADFKLDIHGLNELMKSDEMKAHLKEAGSQVAKAAGGEYDHKTYTLNFVAVENIFPTSFKAARDNTKNNTLLKALGSVGLSSK